MNVLKTKLMIMYRAVTDAPVTTRAPLGLDQVGEHGNWGIPPISGPSHTPEYLLWTLIPWLILDEALYMQSLLFYQKSTKASLRLIDEVDRIAIDPACNSRTLLSEVTPTWSSSYRTDYDVFALHFTLDGAWNQYLGLWDDDGSQRQIATFCAVEE